MHQRIIFLISLAIANYSYAETSIESSPHQEASLFESQETLIKADYLPLQLSNNSSMGLLGIHYEENFLPIENFYTGIGLYTAVDGNVGGYFALGLDNDYFLNLGKYFALNPGIYIGGGGARSAGFGGGLIIMPHLGLDINLSTNSQLGLNYSYTMFPSGNIGNTSQVMVSFQHYSNSYTLPFATNNSDIGGLFEEIKLENDNYFLQPMFSAYMPMNSTSFSGATLSKAIILPGARGGYLFHNGIYTFVGLNGAATGGVNGYMDGIGGIGYKLSFNDTLGWLFEAGVGAGGGGTVDTGGGLLLNPATGLEINLTRHWALNGTVGYIVAPEGNFQAVSYNAGLKYNFNNLQPDINGLSYSDIELSKWRFDVYNQTLFNPQRNGANSGDINQFSFEADQFLSDNFFINYGANFAYSGENSGGLAGGTIGIGAQLNLDHFHPYVLLPVGAVGGGNINAGDGLIIEPNIGTYFDLSRYISLNIAGGIIQSFNGRLQSQFVNAGIAYRFSKVTAE